MSKRTNTFTNDVKMVLFHRHNSFVLVVNEMSKIWEQK